MRALLAALVLALAPACISTPEQADVNARLIFAVAGALDSAADTTTDTDLAEELAVMADISRAVAGVVRTGGLEGEERALALVQEIRSIIRVVLPSADEDLASQLVAIDVMLGSIVAFYTPLP
jgi:hypothetical protein